jgi:protein-S-isoprenylcysteine O-methyltransferase Ste14
MNTIFFNNYFPAIIWTGFHFWKFSKMDFTFFSLLMIARALIVLWCFMIREIPKKRAPIYQIIIAWASTALPAFMIWQIGSIQQSFISVLFAVIGLLLFSLACLDLGKSFGISPAIRSPIQCGIYKYVNHPLYISHVILEIGILINNPNLANAIILVCACGFYLLRCHWEQQLLKIHVWS